MTFILRDRDALFHITDITFLADGSYNIYRTTGGYDVDGPRPGPSTHTEEISYQDLLWEILNHIHYHDYKDFVVNVVGTDCSLSAYPDPKVWKEIVIALPSTDPESYGTVYRVQPNPEWSNKK